MNGENRRQNLIYDSNFSMNLPISFRDGKLKGLLWEFYFERRGKKGGEKKYANRDSNLHRRGRLSWGFVEVEKKLLHKYLQQIFPLI